MKGRIENRSEMRFSLILFILAFLRVIRVPSLKTRQHPAFGAPSHGPYPP